MAARGPPPGAGLRLPARHRRRDPPHRGRDRALLPAAAGSAASCSAAPPPPTTRPGMPRPTLPRTGTAGATSRIVVWATTIGAVLGPNLVGVAGQVAQALGIPALTGPFLFSLAGFVLAATAPGRSACGPTRCCSRGPGPQAAAVEPPGAPRLGGSRSAGRGRHTRRAARAGHGRPRARRHGQRDGDDAAAHAPRRRGPAGHRLRHQHPRPRDVRVLAAGRVRGRPLRRAPHGPASARPCWSTAALLAAQAPTGWSAGLAVALFLLGLGWSFTLVSGSTLIAGAVPVAERAGVQGASDLAMGLAAGRGGALAGVVVGRWATTCWASGAAVVAALIAVAALTVRQRRAPGGRSRPAGPDRPPPGTRRARHPRPGRPETRVR